MIIRFSVENWLSFRDATSFSMIASREQQHRERVSVVNKYKTGILPIAAIYGGNASGKTNFLGALNFVKQMVVRGVQPDSMIQVEPFRLDGHSLDEPSRFTLELLVEGSEDREDTIYEFSFAATRKIIVEEKLVEITKASEKILYHRQGDQPHFHGSLDKEQFLHFAFQGTRDNQLFLTNAISQKVDIFRPVYDWFQKTLTLIAPDDRFDPFEAFCDKGHPLYDAMNDALSQLDTGISHLGGEAFPFDNLPFPDELKNRFQEDVKEGESARITIGSKEEQFIVTRTAGELVTKKLVAYHQKPDGTEAAFTMSLESAGSRRVIDLLPAFLELTATDAKKVYVIDEIDRSLHTLLTRRLLETYLATCSADRRSQMLFTTHDVLLLDQNLLRRDEIWVAERDAQGASRLFSFSDYKDLRKDKDIRKSYLQGRLGGIPRILLNRSTIRQEVE